MISHNNNEESDSGSDSECWTSWFCSTSGNDFFCQVKKAYIEDTFNLYGLKHYLPQSYNKALDLILDRLSPGFNDIEEVSRAAVLLYGLIHARYIITNDGLEAMKVKYLSKDFGECPRLLCRGHTVLPMGTTDEPKQNHVKLFCPKCKDVYNCSLKHRDIDGAFFGPTFPNLFFMTFTDLIPENKVEIHVPRVFGFKINNSNVPSTNNSNNSLVKLFPNRQFITKSKSGCGDDDDSSNDIPNKRSYETMENDNKLISKSLNDNCSTKKSDDKVTINSKKIKSSTKTANSSSK